MSHRSKLSLCIAAGSLAAPALGQWDITAVERDLSLFASVAEPGANADTEEDTILNNSVNFQGMVEVDVQSGAFTSIQAMLTQESSLVGNTLSASSRRGLGYNAFSGSSGGANADSSVRFDFRIDAATDFELVYDISGVVPFGFASPIQIFGTPDGGVQETVVFHLDGFGSDSGTLLPGDYSIQVTSSSEGLDFFDTFNPDPSPFVELDVWDFQLTLIPSPSTGAILLAGSVFASRRRR
ncbi:MAG: hypothetical protein Phyf2KO_08110 [Phycisphaerales bacterium]